jgi:hypothetical protein
MKTDVTSRWAGILALTLLLLVSGCTSLRPTEASPEDLQRMITQENLIQPGDRVRLVTADEAVYRFRVTRVDLDEGLIAGRAEAVPIAEIVAVETREVSVGKTAALTGGLIGAWVLILILVAPALAIGAAGV